MSGESLFRSILRVLDEAGVLQDLVLVGSWALPMYRELFHGDPRVPLLRTLDVDFLVGMPPRFAVEADVPRLLSDLGFEAFWATQGEYCKYVHPDMEVEFLVPELGRGRSKAYPVASLKVMAQPLRYLGLAYDHSITVPYEGIDVRVPEPTVFVLLKLLVSPRRKLAAEATRDIHTAVSLGSFLLEDEEQRDALVTLYSSLPRGWRVTIDDVAHEHFEEMANALSLRKSVDR